MMKEMNNVRELFPKGSLRFIAGPCAVESRYQMMETAKFLSTLGVKILRGGAFKPRTSPDSFQGLAETGLKLMRDAADKYNMLVVTEVSYQKSLCHGIQQVHPCACFPHILPVPPSLKQEESRQLVIWHQNHNCMRFLSFLLYL